MNHERLMNVLLGQRVTEKSALGAGKRRLYIFQVAIDATKIEIKQAVKLALGKNVYNVRTVKVKGKEASFGRTKGRHASWKKAYITLVEGEELELGEAA